MKVLVDSDVSFDFISGRLPYYNEALKLFTLAESDVISVFSIPHLLINIWQVRSHMGIKSAEMNKSISRLLNIVKVLDEHSTAFIKALQAKRVDLEDSMVIECAVYHKMDIIVTRNIKHFKLSPVQVLSPKELLLRLGY